MPFLAQAADLTIPPETYARVEREVISRYKQQEAKKSNEWTTLDWTLQGVGSALIVIDMCQTVEFTSRGVRETNPLIGPHPSHRTVLIAGAVGMGLFWGTAYLLPKPWRTMFQSSVVGIESYTTYWNKFQVHAGCKL
jgi:hypothetical protein